MGSNDLPLCEAWFEAERVDDHLFRIFEPHVGPLIQSNTWLLTGATSDLLVDTGNGLAPLRPFLQRFRPDPDKPLIAVATHAHMDHVCGLHEFEQRLLHPADVRTAEVPDRLLFSEEVWPGARAQMAEAGYPLAPLGIQAAPFEGFDPRAFEPPGVTPTRLVEEGDAIDLGDRMFEVLHLPGHTDGSIGLWDAANGTLFSGDAVYAGRSRDRHGPYVGHRAVRRDDAPPPGASGRRGAWRPRPELRAGRADRAMRGLPPPPVDLNPQTEALRSARPVSMTSLSGMTTTVSAALPATTGVGASRRIQPTARPGHSGSIHGFSMKAK